MFRQDASSQRSREGTLLTCGMAVFFLIAATPDVAETSPAPVTYKMQLVWIAGTEPPEWVFVVGQVGFKSPDSFKEFVGRLPKGSTLEWAPGCKRIGGEPLGLLSNVVDGRFSGGGLLPHTVDEDGALDDLGQERRTVQRTPLL